MPRRSGTRRFYRSFPFPAAFSRVSSVHQNAARVVFLRGRVLLAIVLVAVVVVLPVAPLLARFTVQGSRVPPPTQWTRSRRRMRRRRASGSFHTRTSADDCRRAASRPSDAHERAGSRCAPLNETWTVRGHRPSDLPRGAHSRTRPLAVHRTRKLARRTPK